MDYEYNVQMHPNQTSRQNGILLVTNILNFVSCRFMFTIFFNKNFIQHTNNSRYKKLGAFH